LNRVIRNAAVTAAPPAFGNGNGGLRFVDDATALLIEEARAEAFAAGRREGVAAGRAEMEGAITRVDAALRAAVQNLNNYRANAVAETLDAALEVAAFVVGELPPDEGAALAGRIEDAVAGLDDEDMIVAIHPQDWDSVSEAVRLPNGITMQRDPSLRPGEARINGRWATAELTREAALQVAREVLS
jgi:flagellar biosynthesis/type III secretory pathway protein FliH